MIKRMQILVLILIVLGFAWLWTGDSTREEYTVPGAIQTLPGQKQPLNLPRPRQANGLFIMAAIDTSKGNLDQGKFLAAADNYVKEQRSEHGLREEHRLKGTVSKSPIGAIVSYDVYHDNMPIIGMRIEVRLDNALTVAGSNWNYRPIDLPSVEEGGQPLYDEMVSRMPSGFQLRADGSKFSEVIYEIPNQGRGEHSVVVPAINQFQVPVNLIVRASDGALLSVEMPRYEIDRRNRGR